MTTLFTHEFLSSATWYLAGWTMLHFLWVGALLGIVAAALRLTLRTAPANVRYAALLTMMLALVIAPPGITWWLVQSKALPDFAPQPTHQTSVAIAPQQPDGHAVRELHVDAPPAQPLNTYETIAPRAEPSIATTQTDTQHTALALLNHCVTLMPWIWLIGTPLVFAWLALGLTGAERLRRRAVVIDDGPLHQACTRLARELRIRGRVTLAVCERIASPVLVGIVRPMILVPPAALTGYAPEEIEMVLLHELAHVRRWDNLVNLGQRVVEACLFFHPVVWLVSGWVRQERENCCDAFVVVHTAKPQAYAELLVNLAASRSPLAGVALARHPLAQRIRNILKLEDPPMFVSRSTLSIAFAALAALLAVALWQPSSPSVAQESILETVESFEGESDELDLLDPDDETIHAWFKVSKDNPMRTKRYEVHGKEAGGVESLFRGITKDPYGPQIAIQRKWIVKDKTVEIDAPAQAHKEFFPPLFEAYYEIEDDLGDMFRLENLLDFLVQFDKKVNDNMAKDKQDQNSIPPELISPNPPPASPFPTLEEQKVADRAWKMLGLELEKIGEDDIKRVKKLGFEGGLKVTVASSRITNNGFSGERISNPIQVGDLLVGLHVWPTKTLTDVGTVLERPDLVELSPLKFYVVRRQAIGRLSRSQEIQLKAKIAEREREETRRIHQERRSRSRAKGKELKDAEPEKAEGGYGGYGGGRGYGGMEGGYGGYGEGYGGMEGGFGMEGSMEGGPPKVKDEVITGRIEVMNLPVSNFPRILPPSSPNPPVHPDRPGLARQGPYRQKWSQNRPGSDVQGPYPPPVQKPTLLYDGKTFEQWRDQWRNELKTERRRESLHALAAFGRERMGREVAEVVLEAAGNFDYSNYTRQLFDTPERKLKDEILSVLAGSPHTDLPASVPMQAWLPLVLERLSDEPEKWEDLTVLLLDRLDINVRGRLVLIQPLTEHERPRIREVAKQLMKRPAENLKEEAP